MAATQPTIRQPLASEVVRSQDVLVVAWAPYAGDGSLASVRVIVWDGLTTTWLDTGYRAADGVYLGAQHLEVPSGTLPSSTASVRIDVYHRNSLGETSSVATILVDTASEMTTDRWEQGQ